MNPRYRDIKGLCFISSCSVSARQAAVSLQYVKLPLESATQENQAREWQIMIFKEIRKESAIYKFIVENKVVGWIGRSCVLCFQSYPQKALACYHFPDQMGTSAGFWGSQSRSWLMKSWHAALEHELHLRKLRNQVWFWNAFSLRIHSAVTWQWFPAASREQRAFTIKSWNKSGAHWSVTQYQMGTWS